MVTLTPDQHGTGMGDPGSLAGTATDAPGWTPPAWEDVVREHGDRVYRLAYRLSGNQHDAEDITQETFIRVFRSLASYKPGSFEGWLHRITTNVFLDLVRRRQRIRMEALPEESDRIAGREPSPEQVFQDSNLDPDLQAALDELLPEFRAAVVLCDVEGLSYEEIGATLGVKIGTVRSRIHRGRQALRAGLERRRAERAAAEAGPSVRVPAGRAQRTAQAEPTAQAGPDAQATPAMQPLPSQPPRRPSRISAPESQVPASEVSVWQ